MFIYFVSDAFINLHVALSLVGIASGLIAVFGLMAGKLLPGWTPLFLSSTLATSVSGFGIPAPHLLPSHYTGFISLAVLAIAFVALYWGRLAGAWRWIYAVTAVVALYLNVFVLVVQTFRKVPDLRALAPTESEPPFLYAQIATLALFAIFAIIAAIRLRADPAPAS